MPFDSGCPYLIMAAGVLLLAAATADVNSGQTIPKIEAEVTTDLWMERLTSLDRVAVIGVFDGDPPYVFGRIRDGLILPANRFALLDDQYAELRTYDLDGNHLATAGGYGQGPGEFTAPFALERLSRDSIGVLDGRGHISIIHVANEVLRFAEGITFSLPPRDFCYHLDRLYVQGFDRASGMTVHSFDRGGAYLNSFDGAVYSNWIAAVQQTDGFIACASSLVHAAKTDSVVKILDYGTGSVTHSVKIRGFSPIVRETLPDGSIRNRLSPNQSQYNMVETVNALDSTTVLIQVGNFTPAAGESLSRSSFLLDISGGGLHRIDADLPRLLDLTESYALSAEATPYPQASIWRYQTNR